MNIRDIAQLANVTPGTVSRVLNHYPDVSEQTRQRVLKIIEENQYTPRNSARQLKMATRLPQICIALEGVTNWISENIETTLLSRFYNADYPTMAIRDNHYGQDKAEKFNELTAYAKRNNLTGLIYIGGNFCEISPQAFQNFPCPIIFVNTYLPASTGTESYSSIQVNHYETAMRQMNSLIEQGHRHICVLITSFNDISIYQVRFDAYREALARHGLSPDHIVEGRYDCVHTYKNLLQCLKSDPQITAVCCGADIMAAPALRAIHDVGRAPGKDIALISFDGMYDLQYYIPSVTTFVQPWQEMANYTYDLLPGLMNGTRQHQHITFQTRLWKNESNDIILN